MPKIYVFMNITLDGVMQAPGRADEDTRDGFEHGGWGAPYAAMASSEARESLPPTGAMLFGRWTYEHFYAFWPNQTNNPYTDILNNTRKYVASRTLREPLPWVNSTLLKGEAAETVRALKAQPGPDIMMMGSGALIQTLTKHNLVDLYVLMIHPLVLGSGRRLFPDNGNYANLELVSTRPVSNGVLVVTYQPVNA